MFPCRYFVPLLFLSLTASSAQAAPTLPAAKKFDVSGLIPALAGGSTDAVAGAIRGYLVRSLPNPLYEVWPGWGATKNRGGKAQKNGRWKHIRVTVLTPADTLVFDLRNLQNPEPGRVTFTVFLSFDVRGEYEMQRAGSPVFVCAPATLRPLPAPGKHGLRGNFPPGSGSRFLAPDGVFRFHITRSDLNYDNFVTEHIAGLGGDAADLIGDAVHGSMKKWYPSLERDLLARANAAIEKAADTKEVRVSLSDLLKKKGWLTAPSAAPAPSNASGSADAKFASGPAEKSRAAMGAG